MSVFVPRWTFPLGVLQTSQRFRQTLESNDVLIDRDAHRMLARIPCLRQAVKRSFAVATIEELGFASGATMPQARAAVLAQGGQLCAAEVGPVLRLFYLDQARGEYLYLAMDPVLVSRGNPRIFSVGCDDEGTERLEAANGHSEILWGPESRIVFQLPPTV